LTAEELDSEWLVCGRFGRPHGVKGEVRLWSYNQQTEALQKGMKLLIGPHPKHQTDPVRPAHSQLTLSKVRVDGKGLVVGFKELRFRDQAQALNHLAWLLPRKDFPELADDEFYLFDLIGAEGWAVDPSLEEFTDTPSQQNSTYIGKLTGLLEAGAGELLIFEGGDCGEVNIPNQDPFVVSIDLDAKRIIVRAIPGLLEGGL
jgi:16S rRNA processing protein RimM